MKKNSIEYRQKVSDFMKERWLRGLSNGFKPGNKVNLGKKYSQDRVEKVRSKQIGKYISDESRLKMSIAHKGKKMPEEVIAKIKSTYLKKSLQRVKVESRNNLIRKSMVYKMWRDMVFKRDNYTCSSCLLDGGTLNAHHICEFAHNPEKRFELDNGQTLCYLCHRKLHMIRHAEMKYKDVPLFVKLTIYGEKYDK